MDRVSDRGRLIKHTALFIAAGFSYLAMEARAATATLLLNEMNPNLANGHDLIELLVTKAGDTAGMRVEQIGSTTVLLATLPSLPVQKGDLIVIHLTPTGTVGIGPISETVSKTEHPAAMFSANYDTAWDVLGENVGATYGYRVIAVKEPGGAIQDAVPFYLSSGTATGSFPTDLQQIQAQGLWLPVDCAGTACNYSSSPTATDVAVNWLGMGTTVLGNSIQRRSAADGNVKEDWNVQPSTFGFLNTNQALLFIQHTGATLTVSFNAGSPGFVLEQSTNLAVGPWTAGPAGNPTAAIPATNSATFFRLRKP